MYLMAPQVYSDFKVDFLFLQKRHLNHILCYLGLQILFDTDIILSITISCPQRTHTHPLFCYVFSAHRLFTGEKLTIKNKKLKGSR